MKFPDTFQPGSSQPLARSVNGSENLFIGLLRTSGPAWILALVILTAPRRFLCEVPCL